MYSRAEPKRSEFFQALEQRAIARTGQIAKGVSNKRLEARNAGVQQLFQPIDGVVAISGEAASDAEKSLVTKLARDIRGVKSVTNFMTVKN